MRVRPLPSRPPQGAKVVPGVHLPIGEEEQPPPGALLYCPIRGPLNVYALARDGLTATEEARRIDFIRFLLDRQYPEDHVAVETVIIKKLGESGRNTLRCDVIVYDQPVVELEHLDLDERIARAIIVAEIKRNSNKRTSAWTYQLEPAMRQLPGMGVMGAYWDGGKSASFCQTDRQ